ncbi:hypothetical protein HK102_011090 [Quaeritorhiza haematococci]|nr:hypothetical protein HK102_011090 [Quaeritorhiza haematococci]
MKHHPSRAAYSTNTTPESTAQETVQSQARKSPPPNARDLSRKLEGYPILRDSSNPRPNLWEPTPSWWPFWDAWFLGPARRKLAQYAATGLLAGRMSRISDDYYPNEFLSGASGSARRLFDALSGWNGEENSELRSMLSPRLYERFQSYHQKLAAAGVIPYLRLIHVDAIDPIEPKDVWFAFGPSSIIDSTIPQFKRILRFFNPNAVLVDLGKRQHWYFRQVTFGYAVHREDFPEEQDTSAGPQSDALSAAMKEGHVVGVDVEMTADVEFGLREISSSSSSTEDSGAGFIPLEDGAGGGPEVVRRTITFRFESSHFNKDTVKTVRWRIADVDNCLISEVAKLEEKFVKQQEGDGY